MSSLALCRVCLANNVRMCVIINTPMQQVFEKITNLMMTSEDSKPNIVCYICYHRLRKCQVLISKALKADNVLNQVLQCGLLMNQDGITESDAFKQITLRISPVECISVTGNDDTYDKIDEVVTDETAIKKEEGQNDLSDVKDTNNYIAEMDNHMQSDSDDDIPLKNFSMRKTVESRKVKVRKKDLTEKKEQKGFIADFAREIILSKEQQLQEMVLRAKSLNYLNSPLKCELCYKGFVDMRAYDNHREKHDEKSGAHSCEICLMRYRTSRQLRTHCATAHARRYACYKCAHRSHTANQAREHEKWHSGYTYECKLCGQKFRKPTSYLTHMRKRHPTQHVCATCGDSFVTRHGLLMHNSKSHRRIDKSDENTTEPASERYCAECNIQFLNIEAWKRHILSSVKHKNVSSENSLKCKICDAHLTSSAQFTSHLREHERALKSARVAPLQSNEVTAQLACDQCGANFVNRSKLQAHVKRIHLGLKYNKNIVCEVCGKKCTSNASLKYHQRTHTGERPFQCGACTKRFSDNNQLRIHTRTHTGERPYCCAACGKRFSQKPALNRHYRVHTGAKPYVCQFCSKTFSQSNSLKLHVRTIHLKMQANRRGKVQNTTQDVKVEDTVTLQNL